MCILGQIRGNNKERRCKVFFLGGAKTEFAFSTVFIGAPVLRGLRGCRDPLVRSLLPPRNRGYGLFPLTLKAPTTREKV
jgi:hypothetical protein